MGPARHPWRSGRNGCPFDRGILVGWTGDRAKQFEAGSQGNESGHDRGDRAGRLGHVDPRSVAGSKAGAAGTGRFIVAQSVDDGHRLGNDAPGSEEPDRDVAPACLDALAVKTP